MLEFNRSAHYVRSRQTALMIHRIFIAINLPAKAKAELFALRERYAELPARWTKPNNLHVTLEFLGNMSDKEIETVKESARTAASKSKPFQIKFNKVVYGPHPTSSAQGGLRGTSMIWAIGETPQELAELHGKLREALKAAPGLSVTLEPRPFSPHVTLARFNEWELRRIDPEELPDINEDIDIACEARSIEIMESVLKPSGPEYAILESIPLQG